MRTINILIIMGIFLITLSTAHAFDQIAISQINQTNGEKFSNSVIDTNASNLTYPAYSTSPAMQCGIACHAAVTNVTASPYSMNGSNVSYGTVAIAYGGTGATTATQARSNLGVSPSQNNLSNISVVSGNTTLSEVHYTVIVNASLGDRIITLPLASGNLGKIYQIKNNESHQLYEYGGTNYSNNVSIVSQAGEKFSNNQTYINLSMGDTASIQSDGKTWNILTISSDVIGGIRVRESSTVQYLDTSISTTGATLAKLKGFIVNERISGRYNISFNAWLEVAGGGFCRIYLNGIPYGQQYQVSIVQGTTYRNSFDVPLNPGNNIDLYCKNSAAQVISASNFSMNFNNTGQSGFTPN